jgi:hypothetical protein
MDAPMDKPPRPKSIPPDILPQVADRLRYKKLTPDEEQDFIREQAKFEAPTARPATRARCGKR